MPVVAIIHLLRNWVASCIDLKSLNFMKKVGVQDKCLLTVARHVLVVLLHYDVHQGYKLIRNRCRF